MSRASQETLAHRLTHRDLEHTPDDGNRYEVIDGALHVSPFPTYAHQHAASHLLYVLRRWALEKGLGTVLGPGLKLALTELWV